MLTHETAVTRNLFILSLNLSELLFDPISNTREIRQIFLNTAADPNTHNEDTLTVLHVVVKDRVIMRNLLLEGANLNNIKARTKLRNGRLSWYLRRKITKKSPNPF